MRLIDMPASATALGIARIVVFALWLRLLLRSLFAGGPELPFEWFRPWGPLILLPEFALRFLLEPQALFVLKLGAAILALLLLLGARPFGPLAWTFAATAIVWECLVKGYNGYANHALFALHYATWILAMFPAGDGLSILGRRRRRLLDSREADSLYGAPMNLALIMVGLTYMVIGVRRFMNGGVAIFFDDTIVTYLIARSLEYSQRGFSFGLIAPESDLLAITIRIGYFVTTIAEVVAPLVLIFGWRLRAAWLAVIVPFHFLSWFTMNIFFRENVVLLLVFFTGLPQLLGTRWDRYAIGKPWMEAGPAPESRT